MVDRVKLDQLRSGLPVEFEPGIYAKINTEKKSLDLSDGTSLPIPKEKESFYFPSEKQKRVLAKEESVQQKVQNIPFGEALFKAQEHSSLLTGLKTIAENYLQKPVESLQVQPGQETMSFLERLGENKANEIMAQQKVSQQISEESPISTAAGAGLGLGLDLYATRGLTPAKGAMTLAAAGNLDKIVSEPDEFTKDILLAGAGGKALDKVMGGLSKIAQSRSARRNIAQDIEKINAENLAGEQTHKIGQQQAKIAHEANKEFIQAQNLAERQRIEKLNLTNKQAIEKANIQAKEAYQSQLAANQQAMDQYNLAKSQREQEIFNLTQKYQVDKAARETEIFRLKQQAQEAKAKHSANEAEKTRIYKEALENYEKENSLADLEFKSQMEAYKKELDLLPKMQEAAQKDFSANTTQAMEKAIKIAGKDASFSKKQLGIDEFIDQFIGLGEKAATKEAREVSGFLRSIFSKLQNTGKMSADEFLKAFKNIESRISKSSPETKLLLGDFKDYLSQRLPQAIADSKFYAKHVPKIEKELSKLISSIAKKEGGLISERLPGLKQEINNSLKSLTPEQFSQMSRNGILKNYLVSPQEFITFEGKTIATKSNLSLERQKINELIQNRLDKYFSDLQNDAFISYIDIKKALRGNISKTKGFAPQIPEPVAPSRNPVKISEPLKPSPAEAPAFPAFPEPIQPPIIPPPVPLPQLKQPTAPASQKFIPEQTFEKPLPGKFVESPFIPQNVPQMPEATNIIDKLAQGLENLNSKDIFKSKGIVDNPITKLAALKYVLGGAALPVEAATAAGVVGLKTLTSPSAIGSFSRKSLQYTVQGAIDEKARQYPSYRNGILDNPQERRSLVKQIEEDPDMTLEDKAIYQSKVNRGVPL